MEIKALEYRMVYGSNAGHLSLAVNNLLQSTTEQWLLHGDPKVVYNERQSELFLYQALIRVLKT